MNCIFLPLIVLLALINQPSCVHAVIVNDVWNGLTTAAAVASFLADKRTTAIDDIKEVGGVVVVGNGSYPLKDCLEQVSKVGSKRLILIVDKEETLKQMNDSVMAMKPTFATFILRLFIGPNGAESKFNKDIHIFLKMSWPTETKLGIGFMSFPTGKIPGYGKPDMDHILPIMESEFLKPYLTMVEMDVVLLSRTIDSVLGPDGALLNRLPLILLRNLVPAHETATDIVQLRKIVDWLGKDKFIMDIGDSLLKKLNAASDSSTIHLPFCIIFTLFVLSTFFQ